MRRAERLDQRSPSPPSRSATRSFSPASSSASDLRCRPVVERLFGSRVADQQRNVRRQRRRRRIPWMGRQSRAVDHRRVRRHAGLAQHELLVEARAGLRELLHRHVLQLARLRPASGRAPRAACRLRAGRLPASSAAARAPLSMIARWNSPFALGIAISVATLRPPPDCPKIVTRFGSPPKRSMLSRTHSSAATMSSMPTRAGRARSRRPPLRQDT